MKLGKEILELDEVTSTQALAAEILRGERPHADVVFAHDQVQGRGRFDRVWVSHRGDSLTMSLLFHDYAGHSQPWLVGMSVAVAVAETLECQLRWPNDLSLEGKKIGGILTELLPNHDNSLVPVVGLGINLNQATFPTDIAASATSMILARGVQLQPEVLCQTLLERIREMPEVLTWSELEPFWMPFDDTPRKRYRLRDGSEGVATSIGPEGQLLVLVDGRQCQEFAADAIFGV